MYKRCLSSIGGHLVTLDEYLSVVQKYIDSMLRRWNYCESKIFSFKKVVKRRSYKGPIW